MRTCDRLIKTSKHRNIETSNSIRFDRNYRIESNRIESNRVESNRVESNRVESSRIESSRIESNRIESSRVESNRIESNRVESNRIESNRIESSSRSFPSSLSSSHARPGWSAPRGPATRFPGGVNEKKEGVCVLCARAILSCVCRRRASTTCSARTT